MNVPAWRRGSKSARHAFALIMHALRQSGRTCHTRLIPKKSVTTGCKAGAISVHGLRQCVGLNVSWEIFRLRAAEH